MGEMSGDEMQYRALEWVHGIVREWLTVNETARACQRGMPPSEQERLARLPAGFEALAATMAGTLNQETLIVAHAVLTSAEVQLRSLMESGSLSHPLVRVDGILEAEIGATEVDGDKDLAERVRRLEAENDTLRRSLTAIQSLAGLGLDEGVVDGPHSLATRSV